MTGAERTLRWPGCANVRDLGGLPVAGGGRIRPGVLVRGDRPRRASVAAMLGHGVRLVVDLRSTAERAADPGPCEPRIAWRHLPVLREEDAVLEEMAGTLTGIYRRILDHGARSLAAVVSAIAHAPPGATLVHCHSGKDRTGLAIALTLTLAGVAPADVAADYAETAARMSLDATWPPCPARRNGPGPAGCSPRSAPARCSPPSPTWTTGTAAPGRTCGRAACRPPTWPCSAPA